MAIFTKQHYQALAVVLSRYREFAQNSHEVRGIIQELASMFSHDNPNFNRAHFLKACGMEDS